MFRLHYQPHPSYQDWLQLPLNKSAKLHVRRPPDIAIERVEPMITMIFKHPTGR